MDDIYIGNFYFSESTGDYSALDFLAYILREKEKNLLFLCIFHSKEVTASLIECVV